MKVFNLRLASGCEVVATAGALILKLDGRTPLSSLKVGDRIAIPRRVPTPMRTQRMADDEVVLLAHMIGDGSCVKRQPIRYASIDAQNFDAVTKAARHFGITAERDEYAAERVTTLRLPAPYHLTHGKRNPIAAWLDALGLFELRSYDKCVPAEIFALPNNQLSLLLGHLWATDGCARGTAKNSGVRSITGPVVERSSTASPNCYCGRHPNADVPRTETRVPRHVAPQPVWSGQPDAVPAVSGRGWRKVLRRKRGTRRADWRQEQRQRRYGSSRGVGSGAAIAIR